MSTPSEKAKELYDKMYLKIQDATAGLFEEDVPYQKARELAAKDCAIICCDEILESWGAHNGEIDKSFYPKELEFWNEVKLEILHI